eukprot:TRINITY_DN6022_c0_g1_i3.p2 TRINITY_DN6022_c0_g1~~TRINITY_DN6022_c0_g1_i3.p2  ORF type:complete len:288 (+),score=122.65 TRINITY_DN6022_c0_g1_i3:1022-1885(+)
MRVDQRLRNYQQAVQPRLADQQRLDEEIALKAMMEREKAEMEREIQSKNAKMQAVANARSLWNEQLERKQRQRDMLKNEDSVYADAVRRNMAEQDELEKKKREQETLARQQYREALEQQMEDTNRKRMYRDVMSEHERKVNSVDLNAYENMEADLLNAKIVGLKDYNTVASVPNVQVGSARVSGREKKASPQWTSSYVKDMRHYNQRLLEPTLKNMQDPRIVFMRNDTNNLAYGYKKEAGLDKYFFPRAGKGSPLQLGGKAQVKGKEDYNGTEVPKYEGGKSYLFGS